MHQPITDPTTSFSGELEQFSQPCFFCSEYPPCDPSHPGLVTLIPQALFSKYASSQNYFYTKQLNDILEEGFTMGCARYRQNLMLDDDQQYLKRQYTTEEFSRKINMLSEYYKFHKDFARFYGLPVEAVMARYYDKRRDFDYKRIRKMLREQKKMDFDEPEEEESDSMMNHSSYVKKSRYSTMLAALQDEQTAHDQSNALMDTMAKLDNIVKKAKSGAVLMGFRLSSATVREEQNQRDRFENWMKKAESKYDSNYTSRREKYDSKGNHNKPRLIPAASNTHIRKPPLKFDFRKKKPTQQTQQKVEVLLPTKRQIETNKPNKCVYNTNINIQIKNALFCQSTPKHPPHTSRQQPSKKGIIVHQQDFNSLKSAQLPKPLLLKNLDLVGGLDFIPLKTKKTKRDKSIQKIYGVKCRSGSLMGQGQGQTGQMGQAGTHRKSKLTLDTTRSKGSRSLKTFKSNEYTYNTERSPNGSVKKGGRTERSQRSFSTSKKSLPKLKPAAPSLELQKGPIKKYDSTFSTSKQNVDMILQRKINVEPSINFQRMRSLV